MRREKRPGNPDGKPERDGRDDPDESWVKICGRDRGVKGVSIYGIGEEPLSKMGKLCL